LGVNRKSISSILIHMLYIVYILYI
jgi:hypothetical protein